MHNYALLDPTENLDDMKSNERKKCNRKEMLLSDKPNLHSILIPPTPDFSAV